MSFPPCRLYNDKIPRCPQRVFCLCGQAFRLQPTSVGSPALYVTTRADLKSSAANGCPTMQPAATK